MNKAKLTCLVGIIPPVNKWKKLITTNLHFLLPSALYLFTRLPRLGSDILNSDGARWYIRSSNFLDALLNGNFIETYQHYQPGVTLMWVRAGVEYFTSITLNFLNKPLWYMENYAYFMNMHMLTKIALVLVLFALFVYQMRVVNNLFGAKTAFIFGVFVAVEPYLVGIDRWVHLTSLEIYFAFSAFLTALYWAKNRANNKLLLLAGMLLALSALSKITGIITLLPILLIVLWKPGQSLLDSFKKPLITQTLILLLSFLTVFAILFPALWLNPGFVLQKIYDAVLNASGVTHTKTISTVISSFSFYANVLFFKLSPVTLMLIIPGLVLFLQKRARSLEDNKIFLLLYILIYYLALSFASKKIDRYSLSFFLPIILFVSTYVSKFNKGLQTVVFLGLVLVSIYAGINNFPVLSSFYSPIAGGENKAIQTGIYDNSGEYFAQAASYLNTQNSKQVFIPNNFESFKFFSNSQVVHELGEADYVLLSLDTKRPVLNNTYCNKLDESFGPKFDKPVVYLFRCDNASQLPESTAKPNEPKESTVPLTELLRETNSLEKRVQKALDEAQGNYGIVVKNLKTGESYSYNEHETFDTASLYKLWVMATAYQQIQAGTLKNEQILSEEVEVLNKEFYIPEEYAEKTEGTVTFAAKEALTEMITVSDNYASMLLSKRVNMGSVATFLKKNGFAESSTGYEYILPTSTAYDMALFMEKLYNGEFVNDVYTQEMLDLLKRQQLNNKLPKYLPPETIVAHKTGELDKVTHDAGIVFTPWGEYVVVVMSESEDPLEANETIAKISKSIYDYFTSTKL